jgi:hypothetical protein
MGRPAQIRDEDIDTETASDQNGFPSSEGLRAHSGLATIMGQIVSQVFRTRRRRPEDIDDVLLSLQSWKETLPPSLRLGDGESVAVNRSVLLLQLLYNQVSLSRFFANG